MPQKGEVVVGRLPETEAGIHDHVTNARLAAGIQSLGETVVDLADDVRIERSFLHGLGSALHVHAHIGHPESGHSLQHTGIHRSRTDVVHHCSTRIHRPACDL